MMPARFRKKDGERGQSLVELAIVVPIVLAIFVSTAELGFIYGKISSIGYASREGARTGSALAHGGATDCDNGNDPGEVDNAVMSAVERIMKSPDSGIDLSRVEGVRIFKATADGNEQSPLINRWEYANNLGPKVDEVDGLEVRLDFRPVSVVWHPCTRHNGAGPDSIGVTVQYKYEYLTPLPMLVDALSGGNLGLSLSETTVMSLNPTVETS